MNAGKKVAALVALLCGVSALAGAPGSERSGEVAAAKDAGTQRRPLVTGEPPPGLSCLSRVYSVHPELRDGGWVGVFPDGTYLAWDDQRTKTFDQRLETPDLEDTLSQRYSTGALTPVTQPDQDPGRIRVDALFRATYGADAKHVEAQLVPFSFFGQPLRVHPRALAAFKAAQATLTTLVAKDPTLRPYLDNAGGTFMWRVIAGTDRLSAHSYGVSIDINVKRSNYWRWDKPPSWKNQIPEPIVAAFEGAGFIWGGRWYHYDTMHFEYRPELFDPECRSP